MSTALVKSEPTVGEIMEAVIIRGDLSRLNAEERTTYYMRVCESIGLNPLTRPLEYIKLNGKEVLYAKRDATDQLRRIYDISVEILEQKISEGLMVVHVRARDKHNRTDEDVGAVNIEGMKGESRANAIMKAITKAKRRVTLSISGLGFLDESEESDVEDPVRTATTSIAAPVAEYRDIEVPVDPQTGEIGPHLIPVGIKPDDSGPDWISWAAKYKAALKAAPTHDELEAWVEANKIPFGNLPQSKMRETLASGMEDLRAKLKPTLVPQGLPEYIGEHAEQGFGG